MSKWYESESKVQKIKKRLYLEEFAHIDYDNDLSDDFQKDFEADVTLAEDELLEDTIAELHEALSKRAELQGKVLYLLEKY